MVVGEKSMSEKTKPDGLTPLGKKLERMENFDGFNGIADFINRLLDAIGSTSWDTRNVSDYVKDWLNKPLGHNTTMDDDIDALMKELHEWEP